LETLDYQTTASKISLYSRSAVAFRLAPSTR
jgi:hypothetical protein